MEAEYNALRNEILSLMQKRDEYTRFAYTVMAAIWTAAFAIENAYIVMLGMLVLIPITIRVTDVLYSSGNVAAYISVFHESKTDAKWETLNYRYRTRNKKQGKAAFMYVTARADFVMLQAIDILIFWLYRNEVIFESLTLDIAIIAMQSFVVVFTCYQCHRSAVADIKREENIKKWIEIKSEMERKEEK